MKYEVLVPTHHKTLDQLNELVTYLSIKCDCLIINQCDNKSETVDIVNGVYCRFINIDNIGISNNRNNLLEYCKGDICICIDDDCPLVDNYIDIIDNTFNIYKNAEYILFNGIVTHENNRLVHNKFTKVVKRFNDVSYAGGPGLVFKRKTIDKYKLRYDTRVGYPNKILVGEDSLFIKSILDSKAFFVRSSEVLFIIKDDVENSSYFNGVTDDFVITKGYINKRLHPYSYWIYRYRYAFRMRKWRNNYIKFMKLISLMKKGEKIEMEINKNV